MATYRWLTQEWLDEQTRLAQDQPERPGATARMQYVITGGPDGEIRYHWVLEDGKLLENRLGDLDDKELTLTQSYEDALLIQKGELDEQNAFMQGRIKVEGNMAKLMALLPITSSAEYRALQAKIRAVTEY
ncbi:MAG TPA: SCP2 sterol-binding domain-containing protein [Acidimicrobiales bacterium]|nr:SCP2 sterol-binding domain-containing protein [Acidimicrobiales bacterium]